MSAIVTRRRVDGQDRYGYPDGTWSWSRWEVLESGLPIERVEARLTFWRELNDYAVKERGARNTQREHKVVSDEDAITIQAQRQD